MALQLQELYPVNYEEYKKTAGPEMLGRCLLVQVDDGLYIANLFGQKSYGRDKRHTDYDALAQAMSEIPKNLGKIHLPMGIGCGLAGGDWTIVRYLIEKHIGDCTIIQK